MNVREIQQTIRSVIEQLNALSDSISARTDTPESIEAERRVNSGLCCYCGEPHGDSVIYRGAHEKCYKKVQRAVISKEITDEQAVRRGFWLPADKGGRKPDLSDPLARMIAEKASSPKARKKRS